MELYNYCPAAKENFILRESSVKFLNKKNIRKFILTFDSPVRTNIKENDVVYSELFLAPDKKMPDHGKTPAHLMILVHGFNSKVNWLKNYYCFINDALQNDISCLFINLPYHLYRTPAGQTSGQKLMSNDDAGTLEFFNQAVLDIKKAIKIIDQIFPESNFSFSICGMSLGGIVSAIAMAWDKRIERGAFLICGGNWDEIYWNGVASMMLKGNVVKREKITRTQAKEFYSSLPEFIDAFKKINPISIDSEMEDYPELKKFIAQKWFLCDPVTFGHKIIPRKVIMINSRFDVIFNKESALQLCHEIGCPKIYWLNNFHTTAILRSKKVRQLVYDFFLSSVTLKKA
ncbi:MAG: alpha/beta hydrolase family protein [Actinobacteria bacterium]|nr:alpha/beta hydrolase family protein [Actinomycetota bacterium]